MKRYFLKIEYNGKDFSGFQSQFGQRTVQGEFENALEKLFGEKIFITASGRTDAGVHALDQAIHFDLNNNIPADKLKLALNDILPEDIAVKKVKIVKDNFNARFDIKKKTYLYMLRCGNEKNAISHAEIASVKYDIDVEKLNEIKDIFIGKYNFKGFCSAKTQVKDFEREIYDIKIVKSKNVIKFYITGNGFLYNMIRILVGTMVDYAIGKLTKEKIMLALENGERKNAGKTMPPQGLYLYKTFFS